MKFFSRAQPAARTKPARKVTCVELDAAIAAVNAELGPGSTRETLERLASITAAADDNDTVTLDGPAPVTVAELDEALTEVQARELPASALNALKRVRALVVSAETQEAKAGAAPVTRAELDALFAAFAVVVAQLDLAAAAPPGHIQAKIGYRLERIAKSPAGYGLSPSEAAAFKRLVGAMGCASERDGEAERRRTAARGNGGGALHF